MRHRMLLAVVVIAVLALVSFGVSSLVQAEPLAQDPAGTTTEEGADAGDAGVPAADQGIQPDEDGYLGPVESGAEVPEGAGTDDGSGPAPAPVSSGAIQPDQDGYEGPVQVSAAADGMASTAEGAEELPDWKDISPGPWLDEDEYYQQGGLDAAGADGLDGWSPFYYYNVAGPVFRPRDSDAGWDSNGVCGYRVGAIGAWFNVSINIPDDARVDYVRLYFYDTSGNNGKVWLTDYNGAGGVNDLVSAESAGNAGYGTDLSAYLGEVVDTNNHSYLLNWNSGTDGNTLQLCGVRIAYRLPT